MLAYLKGTVQAVEATQIIMEVNGVGYALNCPLSTLQECRVGMECKLHVYLQVREDAFTLYGFSTEQEKKIFLQLCEVSGVGCKVACAILSGMNVADLATAIAASDVKALSTIKGLGKKTAERIIVELREKVTQVGAVAPLGGEINDAILALETLGMSHHEATDLIVNIPNAAHLSLAQLVQIALRSSKR